jgi:hypothetical protein
MKYVRVTKGRNEQSKGTDMSLDERALHDRSMIGARPRFDSTVPKIFL